MLGLSRTGLSDVALLREFSQLRYLYLEKNGITRVNALCELKNLKQLWLYGNSVPREELIQVEQALPKCEIFI
jgi:Leucine-rich repeat (LRR) protein